jgi:hypothetical protein
MRKLDDRRKDVTQEEVDYSIQAFKASKLKGDARKAAMEQLKCPRSPEPVSIPASTNGESVFQCMSCGHTYTGHYDAKEELVEWSCPKSECKSNSIRVHRKKAGK